MCFSYGGEPAYGILHLPSAGALVRNTGLIFVNSAIRTRCGPHRLYVRLARRLCAAGYHVLRYDPPGIGESLGSIVDAPHYRRRFVDSLDGSVSTVSFFQSETGVNHVGITGLCAGAYCAMVSAAADPRVKFAILASLPVQEVGDLSEEALTNLAIPSYLQKLVNPGSWYNLLTGGMRYDWLLRSVRSLLTKGYASPKLDSTLWQASRRFTETERKTLFIYGEKDWLYEPFVKSYWKKLRRLEQGRQIHELHVVEGSNHIFSQRRWQDELIGKSISWLDDIAKRLEISAKDDKVS